MADKATLKLIGWTFGGITFAVILVASLLVLDAISNPSVADDHTVVAALGAK
jgi:hypothetical protein